MASLEMQTRRPDEVVVADDGSELEHTAAFKEIIQKSGINVVYARQPHDGFRLAANRNNGVRYSSGDYLFFTDADIVFFPDVLQRHVEAAEKQKWVSGFLAILDEEETRGLDVQAIVSGKLEEFWGGAKSEPAKSMEKSEKSFARRQFLARLFPFELFYRRVSMVGCNFSLWRADYEKVNGFDENFKGWGMEDDDFALRLQLAGVMGKSVRTTARVLHLYHPPVPKPLLRHGRHVSENYPYYKRWRRGKYWCDNGLVSSAAAMKDNASGKA